MTEQISQSICVYLTVKSETEFKNCHVCGGSHPQLFITMRRRHKGVNGNYTVRINGGLKNYDPKIPLEVDALPKKASKVVHSEREKLLTERLWHNQEHNIGDKIAVAYLRYPSEVM